MKRTYLYSIIFLISFNASAYVDLGLNYSFSKRRVEAVETDIDPDPGAAVTTTSGYTVNWAWYLWEYTALELNYSESRQQLLDDREAVTEDGTLTITNIDSTLVTQVSGVGLRQAFANRKARIIPSISLGYAKYTTSGLSKYVIIDNGTKVEKELEIEKDKVVSSSSYAAVSLRIRFTQFIGLTLGAKTIMPDFDTSEAENNVTYSAGLSYVF
jgi:hypothetical protein